MEVCCNCEGNGLVQQSFSPDPKQPMVRRTEIIRCPDCLGMGVLIASKQS